MTGKKPTVDGIDAPRAGSKTAGERLEFLNAILAHMHDALFVNKGGRIAFVNEACVKLFRAAGAEALIGRSPFDLFHPEDHTGIAARIKAMNEGGRVPTIEERIIRFDGEAVYVEVTAGHFTDEGERAIVVMLRDVTARRETERSLKEVQRIARLGSWRYRPSAPTLEWSESVYELFGFDPSGPAPTIEQFKERLTPEDRELVERLAANPPTGEIKSFHLTAVMPDGKQMICWAQARAEVCPETGETILRGVCQDVTDREAAAAQLRQAQKMEAVGQLTGGLAHDFNNLLAIVIGNLDLLEEQLADRPTAHECVEEALAAALRGAVLTRQLLAFSRRQPLSPKAIDLNELATGVAELCRRTLGEAVEVRLNLAGDLWLTQADPTQVETAILNLVINARDAMPSGGEVVIETKNVSCAAEDDFDDVSPGDYSVVCVSDTGHGMASEVAARAFEPFFTTKPIGEGTGLGLSMVYGFAQQSGGHVRIYSEAGHGTVVRLYLPRAESAAASLTPGEEASELPLASDETVLLVEDNEGVRRIVARQLRDLGYKVLPASSGGEALALLDEHPQVDLLFTDIVMPGGMDGAELGTAATAKYPQLKVLYTSGFTHWAAKKNAEGLTSLLTKPYRKPDLAAKLREVLDGEAPKARKAAR